MDRLLDDLRTISLAEAGALPLHREPVDLRRARRRRARRAADGRRGPPGRARRGRRRDRSRPTSTRSACARSSSTSSRTRSATRTAGGRVTVEVRSLGADARADGDRHRRGHPADELDRVFDRFHRRSDAGGSGLGLTIVRDLAAAHGGTVEVESDGVPGRGSTFRVRLPRRLLAGAAIRRAGGRRSRRPIRRQAGDQRGEREDRQGQARAGAASAAGSADRRTFGVEAERAAGAAAPVVGGSAAAGDAAGSRRRDGADPAGRRAGVARRSHTACSGTADAAAERGRVGRRRGGRGGRRGRRGLGSSADAGALPATVASVPARSLGSAGAGWPRLPRPARLGRGGAGGGVARRGAAGAEQAARAGQQEARRGRPRRARCRAGRRAGSGARRTRRGGPASPTGGGRRPARGVSRKSRGRAGSRQLGQRGRDRAQVAVERGAVGARGDQRGRLVELGPGGVARGVTRRSAPGRGWRGRAGGACPCPDGGRARAVPTGQRSGAREAAGDEPERRPAPTPEQQERAEATIQPRRRGGRAVAGAASAGLAVTDRRGAATPARPCDRRLAIRRRGAARRRRRPAAEAAGCRGAGRRDARGRVGSWPPDRRVELRAGDGRGGRRR